MSKVKAEQRKYSLREFRFSQDLSQEQFAEKIGYSREAVTQAEAKNAVTDKMLFKLKNAFENFEDAVELEVL